MFHAAGEGQVQVKFPYLNFIAQDPNLAKRLTLTVTIHVRPGASEPEIVATGSVNKTYWPADGCPSPKPIRAKDGATRFGGV